MGLFNFLTGTRKPKKDKIYSIREAKEILKGLEEGEYTVVPVEGGVKFISPEAERAYIESYKKQQHAEKIDNYNDENDKFINSMKPENYGKHVDYNNYNYRQNTNYYSPLGQNNRYKNTSKKDMAIGE